MKHPKTRITKSGESVLFIFPSHRAKNVMERFLLTSKGFAWLRAIGKHWECRRIAFLMDRRD